MYRFLRFYLPLIWLGFDVSEHLPHTGVSALQNLLHPMIMIQSHFWGVVSRTGLSSLHGETDNDQGLFLWTGVASSISRSVALS